MTARRNLFSLIIGLFKTSATIKPLLFSLGVHLFVTLIVLKPISFFSSNSNPEIYTVELINITEPSVEPDTFEPPPPSQPVVKPKPIDEPAVSTKPVLSTRNIPQTPTEIKILRPRKTKKDLRKDQIPIDQTMVLVALERMKKKEQEQLAQEELDEANDAATEANEEMLRTLRESILTRRIEPATANNPSSTQTTSQQPTSNTGQTNQAANSALTQYKATLSQHIHGHWRLPEGQKWDRNLKTTVVVKIKADGIVISSKIFKSSKSKQFDKFVIESIDKASPFPPIPPELDNIPLKLNFYPQGL